MNKELRGSDLTRAMLNRGDKQVWCATSNDSDKQAIAAINNKDYRAVNRIVSFNDGYFLCSTGNQWAYALPIKKVELTQAELGQ